MPCEYEYTEEQETDEDSVWVWVWVWAPKQALHAVVVACAGILLCIAQELVVHALVEGVPQEVAPEAVQPVHLVRQAGTCMLHVLHPTPLFEVCWV